MKPAGLMAIGALLVTGCGSGGAGSSGSPTGRQAEPAGVRVVRAWADSLRRGDVKAAARYFAVPAIVSNGGPPTKLTSAAAVRFFNETLPCGAKVIGSEPASHGFFIVTFALTTRPGGSGCSGTRTNTARTAFRVRGGHITDWVRVQDLRAAPSSQI